MGKLIKISGPNISSKKEKLKKVQKNTKKSEAANIPHKKIDVIGCYFRSLSNNFGTSAQSNINTKRKHDEDSIEDTPETKKPKLSKETSTNESKVHLLNSNANIKFERILTHLDSEDALKDLFHMDDKKASNEYTYYVDWLHDICDEISLEGLDGITIEALWTRMKSSTTYPFLLEGKEEIFWNLLKYITDVEFYILEHPRGNLMIYDKSSHVCPELGIVLEPTIDYSEIYPYVTVNRDGVRGSCSTYHTRMNNSEIIRKLGLQEALDVYGNRLVAVASQKMRENAIISHIADPKIELGDNEYGLLERVGRSRGFGELTQGKVSILNMIKDSRSIFHLRKTLERKKLLKCQFFMLRNEEYGQNKTGKLLHLPRFYTINKTKTLLLIEEIVELLRQKPGYSLDFGEFRRYFPRSTGVNKILKTSEFTKYIKTDIFRPYRYLYPNATASEWKLKNRNKEKNLRLLQLMDPTVNVYASWNNINNDNDNVEDEIADDEGKGVKYINSEFLKEVFYAIFKEGKAGTTLQELVKKVNLDYYTIRIALRKLQAKNVIDTFRTESGKQKHIYYFARCFHSGKRPMPVSRTTKIPENVLQKILQNKKRPERKEIMDNPLTTVNTKQLQRYSSPHFPLHCSAFTAIEETVNDEPMEEAVSGNRILLTFQPKLSLFCDIRIMPKFCEVIFEPGQKVWKFIDPSFIVTCHRDWNRPIKLLLLKCLIMQTKLDVQNMLPENDIEIEELPDLTLDFEGFTSAKGESFSGYTNNRDFLLGPYPVLLSHEKDGDNIEVTITQSTIPKEYITDYTTYVSFDKNATALSLSRTNMILNEINKNLVISDIYKLQRTITDLEKEMPIKKEGSGRIDKNTLHRILLRLINEGYIKILKLFMLVPEKYKVQWMITHPSIDITHPLFRANKEQMEHRFFLGIDKRSTTQTQPEKPQCKKPKSTSPFDSEEATSSIQKLREISKSTSTVSYKHNRHFCRILGYQPKFVRMQLFHELLYYLIYDYKHEETMTRSDIEQVYQYFEPNEIGEVPAIYQKNIDWKMFIPPLPVHKNFPEGWALLCDVILSIPLSLWVKIFHISLECPKLSAYLEHPIRQHYLMKDIPLEYRYILMYRRKYLTNAIELVYRLCFIGLVQMGPQSAHIKDQVFFYLNKKASLLDTSTSGPSYHKITPQQYDKISFNFTSRTEVDNYWCRLWTISMSTPLGQRRVMEGQVVTIESAPFKTLLQDSLKCKTPSEATANDTGHIPGDQLGAAGLDSCMWFHIKRNWIWSRKIPKKSNSEKENQSCRSAKFAGINPLPIRFKELMTQSRQITFRGDQSRGKYYHMDNTVVRRKPKVIHRNILAKRRTMVKQKEMDAKDKLILRKVGKIFRAKFSANEDRMLYICRAAILFLSQNITNIQLSRFLLRDIMHIACPESHDKTSGACARRMTKLTRFDPSMKRLKERTHELINLKELSVHFAPIIFNLNNKTNYSPYTAMEKAIILIHAIGYIYHNFDTVNKTLQGITKYVDFFSPANIDTLSPLLVNLETKKSVFCVPSNEEDIVRESIKSVLMSALHCSRSGQNISYQFYLICKKYSDHLIRAAVTASKGYQAISINKKVKRGSIVRTIPFQLSITYAHMQKCTFSCLTLHTVYQQVREITKSTARYADLDDTQSIFRYSQLLARNELNSAWPGVQVEFNVPDSAHVLCADVKNKKVLITKLAILYQAYLKEKLKDTQNPLKKSKRLNKIGMNIVPPAKCTKRLMQIKTNMNRILSSFPSFCNKTLRATIPLIQACNDEEEIEKYLEIILDTLTNISLNLLSSMADGTKLLEKCASRRPSNEKLIHNRNRLLEVRNMKVNHIIREFLETHHLMDYIHCFESEVRVERNSECEDKLQKWLEKIQINTFPLKNAEEIKVKSEEKKYEGFFRFGMNKKLENSVKVITSVDDIPEVEEIMKGMMEPFSSTKKRNIPHISDVVFLVSEDRVSKTEDEKVLEEIKEQFVAQYPTLEKFEMDDTEGFKRSFNHFFKEDDKPNVEETVYRYCHIKADSTIAMVEKIKEMGGTNVDHLLAGEIIGYVYNQKCMGATGHQIRNIFSSKAKTLDLEVLVQIICDCYIFLEAGVTERLFVHIEHSEHWLVETFHLSPQENHLLGSSGNDEDLLYLQNRISSTEPIKVIMKTWLNLDGTLNKPLFNKWLTIVLSYCLESPGASLPNIFERFYLVKPTELFLLLKVLEKLKCLEIYTVPQIEENLWSDVPASEARPSTILDSFQEMFVNVKQLAASSLGCYLDKDVVDLAFYNV